MESRRKLKVYIQAKEHRRFSEVNRTDKRLTSITVAGLNEPIPTLAEYIASRQNYDP